MYEPNYMVFIINIKHLPTAWKFSLVIQLVYQGNNVLVIVQSDWSICIKFTHLLTAADPIRIVQVLCDPSHSFSPLLGHNEFN